MAEYDVIFSKKIEYVYRVSAPDEGSAIDMARKSKSLGEEPYFTHESDDPDTRVHSRTPEPTVKTKKTEKKTKKEEKKYLTAYEAADELRLSYSTIVRWLSSGKLQSVKVGTQHRISQSEIDRLLGGNR